MGMPLEMNTMIVTKGKEVRQQENFFQLIKDGYRLYPMHVPLEVRKTIEGELKGTAEIHRLEWRDQATIISYELKTLQSSN
ncbi:DUF2584 domain-containing protein [Jeotgalibacillus sp. R-1-5s-1]|uniref:DUF2584 domain-containing protein n=1 Tax=Jeotgalibacillus sp. R-1-5s-1 TaxID=2555897 RepID=UPI001069D3CB|nr:DUF2584 domain-containing protein [Jeotgalibacillus sp. R-1-5s-1]TFD98154.1 DUF2584 domain-containing protein [Jeotgalibacillus sp. R-1-5s-1]